MGLRTLLGIENVGKIIDARLYGVGKLPIVFRLASYVVADLILAKNIGVKRRDRAVFSRRKRSRLIKSELGIRGEGAVPVDCADSDAHSVLRFFDFTVLLVTDFKRKYLSLHLL